MRHHAFILSTLLLSAPLASSSPYFSPSRGEAQARPWRRFSDSIIRKVWGVPEKQTYRVPTRGELPNPKDVPSSTLLARYGDDVVLRFSISTPEEASALAKASNDLFLDVWEFNENWVDIRLTKDVVPSLLGLLPTSLRHSHVALMQDLDLARAVFDTFPYSASSLGHKSFSPSLHQTTTDEHTPPQNANENTNIFFQNFQPLSVITPWLSLMASMFPTHVRLTRVGVSYEGRDIPALRVGVHPSDSTQQARQRKTVLVVGGSHAREWISTSTVNYLAWSLITQYGKVPAVTRFVELYDWVFVPTLNPDGYAYSWETDRLWRKNRQPTSLRFCRGLDLDRSFSFQWSSSSSSTSAFDNPCSEAYAGSAPWEAVESKRLADWARNETEHNNVRFVGLLDLHSYSQQVLYPYAYSCESRPPSLENLEELALGLAKAIRVSHSGQHYIATSACEGNVITSRDDAETDGDGENDPDDDHKDHGDSEWRRQQRRRERRRDGPFFPRVESAGGSLLDYFYHDLRLPYAYQIKLRDTGNYGFLLPPENIVPTGDEVYAALLYLGRYLDGEVGLGGEEDGGAGGDAEAGREGQHATQPPRHPQAPAEPPVRSPFDETKDEDGAGDGAEALEL